MKNILIFALSLMFVLSLTACGGKYSTDSKGMISQAADDIKSDMQSAKNEIEDTAEDMTDADKTNNGITDSSTNTVALTKEKAKETALKHADFKEDEVSGLKIELDTDNDSKKYEIEFYAGGYEYDYEIDAKTGEILKSEKELEKD